MFQEEVLRGLSLTTSKLLKVPLVLLFIATTPITSSTPPTPSSPQRVKNCSWKRLEHSARYKFLDYIRLY